MAVLWILQPFVNKSQNDSSGRNPDTRQMEQRRPKVTFNNLVAVTDVRRQAGVAAKNLKYGCDGRFSVRATAPINIRQKFVQAK